MHELSREHRRALEEGSAISPGVIAERGYYTVTAKKDLGALGFSPVQQRVPALAIPLYAPDGTRFGPQIRPDTPRNNGKGKAIKYETPAGGSIRIDCPSRCQPSVGDPSSPLWVTEGAKKEDALASKGLCAIGLMGVFGFKGRNRWGGTTLLADLDAVACKDREVFICFDSDVSINPAVKMARDRLTEHLQRRGARVLHVDLPTRADGSKMGVDDFFAAGHTAEELKALARPPQRQSESADPSGEQRARVLDQLPGAPVSDGALVPPPYRLRSTGLFVIATKKDRSSGDEYEVEVQVAPAPLVVSNRYRDVDTTEYDLEVSWQSHDKWHSTALRRDIAADHRKLPGAALNGMPVTSLNARHLTDYLQKYETLNLDAIPGGLVTRRCGWRGSDSRLGFVLGDRLIGQETLAVSYSATSAGKFMGENELRLLSDNAGSSHLASALHTKGSYRKWLRTIETVSEYPRVLLTIYASLTPPLLHILQAPNFIIDLCGESSKGKTAAQHGAASVWAYPPGERGGLVLEWNATQVFAERYAELLNDLPMILEDSQTADPRMLGRTIYMLANGVGRGRGSPRGMRNVPRWRGVTISSGERPLSSVAQDAGARARVITLWGSPFGTANQGALVRAFKSGVSSDYGHAGPMFVTWLLAHRSQWDEFRNLYADLTDKLAADFPGAVGDRYSSYFAAMLVAGALASPLLGLPGDPETVIATVMKDLSEPLKEVDTATRALADLLGWASAGRTLFEGQEDTARPPATYLGRWDQGQYIAIYPHRARSELTQMGYSPEAVFQSWRDRGWIKTDEGRLTHKMRCGGVSQGMIFIQWAAVEGTPVTAERGRHDCVDI